MGESPANLHWENIYPKTNACSVITILEKYRGPIYRYEKLNFRVGLSLTKIGVGVKVEVVAFLL